MSEGFLMNSWTAMLFFRICKRYGIEDKGARVALMREIARRGRAKYLRDVNEFVKGKSVLRVTKGGN